MKKYDVIALGELLIDFTENGKSAQGNPIFEANPGGAPCNVLAMLAKLEHKTAFIGKVGKDFFQAKLMTDFSSFWTKFHRTMRKNGFLILKSSLKLKNKTLNSFILCVLALCIY